MSVMQSGRDTEVPVEKGKAEMALIVHSSSSIFLLIGKAASTSLVVSYLFNDSGS